MASTDKAPDPMPAMGSEPTPGEPMSVEQHAVDKSAMMVQSLKPIKQMSQHVCTFAIYSHDMSRQIETHHYCTRLTNQFLQCAVYDSDDPKKAHLIGQKKSFFFPLPLLFFLLKKILFLFIFLGLW